MWDNVLPFLIDTAIPSQDDESALSKKSCCFTVLFPHVKVLFLQKFMT
jgi:hypothetical protein